MEEALFHLLYDDPDIRAKVDDRIWPLERDQGSKLPAITYRRVTGLRDYDMQGATRLVDSRYFVMCWGGKSRRQSAYAEAKELTRLVVARFTPKGGFREVVGSTEIQGIFINSEDDTRTDGATGVGVARVLLDCTFWHKEVVS